MNERGKGRSPDIESHDIEVNGHGAYYLKAGSGFFTGNYPEPPYSLFNNSRFP